MVYRGTKLTHLAAIFRDLLGVGFENHVP